jgi:hypothetical protein
VAIPVDDDRLDQVLASKASAKSSRDDGDWKGAQEFVDEALGALREFAASPASPRWLDVQFADVYGLLGGVEKRWGLSLDGQQRKGHLVASVEAYDRGFEYEKNLQHRDANTYNRVNRLVGRVLVDPHVLGGGTASSAEVASDLRRAEEVVTAQIQSARGRDPWAYCDLGTIQLLRGEPEALATFARLTRMRPPVYVYESTLATLQPLGMVATAVRAELEFAVELLRKSAEASD